MKKISAITIVLTLIISAAFAQTGTGIDQTHYIDSLKKAGLQEAALRNPVLRQASVSGDMIGSSHVRSTLNGTDFFNADVIQYRTASLFNVPVKRWGKNSVSASIITLYQTATFSNVETATPGLTASQLNYSRLTVGVTASFNRVDSLFGKPVYYTANVSSASNDIHSVKK